MMTFIESNTTTLGLGISLDSDGYSTSPSLPSSADSGDSIFSQVPLTTSVSEPDSSPTLGGSSDGDSFTVFDDDDDDDDLNIFDVDELELANEPVINVADFLPWPTGASEDTHAQPICRASPEPADSEADVDAVDGYESDADDQIDDMLWRRSRARRRRANASRTPVERHGPVVELTAAEQAMMAAFSQGPESSRTSPTAVNSFVGHIATERSLEESQHDEEDARDGRFAGWRDYVPGETEFSQLMGMMDIPTDSSEYEEFYASSDDSMCPKRVHYTSESHKPVTRCLAPMTEEQLEQVRRGFALGLPMEEIIEVVTYVVGDDGKPIVNPSDDAHAPGEVQPEGNTSSSDSMETIDLHTTSDEDHPLVEDVAPDVPVFAPTSVPSTPPLFTTSRIQLGPFCVVEGPLLPFAPAPCNTPAIPTRQQPLDFFTLGRGHLSL